jgi:formate dehydrogenase major subunit
MEEIGLTIDGLDIVAEKGNNILEVALKNNIYIPHLCYYPGLKPSGACRLCVVEVGGELMPSCLVPVVPRMVVTTNTPQVERARRAIVELLIADHHYDCRHCQASGHCELQRIMARLHISVKQMRPLRWAKKEIPQDTSHPLFDYDPGRCVLCSICVKTCERVSSGTINFVGRGYGTKLGFFGDKSRCESCRGCVESCPVGALVPKSTLPPSTEPSVTTGL